MNEPFDHYHIWLGIPPAEQPPHHYRLLGIGLFEDNREVISNAADRLMLHLRSFHLGPHSHISQQMLNEIAAARACLLDRARKDQYDAGLRHSLAPRRESFPSHDARLATPARGQPPPPMDVVIGPTATTKTTGTRTPSLRRRNQPLVRMAFIILGAFAGVFLGWWMVDLLTWQPREDTAVVPPPVHGPIPPEVPQHPFPQPPTSPPQPPTSPPRPPASPPKAPTLPPATPHSKFKRWLGTPERWLGTFEPPGWWDEEIRKDAEYFCMNDPDFSIFLADAYTRTSGDRSEAAAGLVTRLKLHGYHLSVDSMLLHGLLARDPEVQRTDELVNGLSAVIADCTGALPDEVTAYDEAIWALRFFLDALVYPDISPTRKDHLATRFTGIVGVPIDVDASIPEITQQWGQASALRLYAGLATHGPSNPRHAALLQHRISSLCRSRLSVRDVPRLDAEFLIAMMPHLSEEDWRSYMHLITRTAWSRDPSILLPFVDAYARTENPTMDQHIGDVLRRHVRGPGRYEDDKDAFVSSLREQIERYPQPRSR